MTKYAKAGPTHEQIAMYGHIAAALRKVMADNDWTVGDLSHACGMDRKATTMYPYLGSRGAPREDVRAMISKALGIPEEQLMPRDLATAQTQVALPVKRLPAARIQVERIHTLSSVRIEHNPVLSFTVSADGTARIKLDAVMPLAAASPLLRILLDAGLVTSTQGDE